MRAEYTIHPLNMVEICDRPLNNPLCTISSPEIEMAQREVMQYIDKISPNDKELAQELQRGKMLGVMIVRQASGEVGFLAGFSGTIATRVEIAGFVPPIFSRHTLPKELLSMEQTIEALTQEIQAAESSADYLEAKQEYAKRLKYASEERARATKEYNEAKAQRDADRRAATRPIAEINHESQHQKGEMKRRERALQQEVESARLYLYSIQDEINALTKRRGELSYQLQRDMFTHYRLTNGLGESRSLLSIFEEHNGRLPPSGSGECAAPKMLHYAFMHNLTPLLIGEFWYGDSPQGEVRHHGQLYGACKSRCEPILGYMLQGVDAEPLTPPNRASQRDQLKIVFEDQHLVVFDKPSGMLSVPGKSSDESVSSIVRELYPDATGAMMVHRLDQDTSGLLLVAKSAEVHKALQRQFAERALHKQYIAIIEGVIPNDSGEIELPIRANIEDRPRQMVDFDHGKSAHTTYQVIERNDKTTRLALTPHTGRTHQLRLHCAHSMGLNAPIVGDRLYGCGGERLMLHAEQITFRHPITEKVVTFRSPAQF